MYSIRLEKGGKKGCFRLCFGILFILVFGVLAFLSFLLKGASFVAR